MEKRVQDYTSEILEVVKSNASPAVLCQRLQDYHKNDIADILEKLSPAERCIGSKQRQKTRHGNDR